MTAEEDDRNNKNDKKKNKRESERSTIPDGNNKKARARKNVQEGEQDRASGQWRSTTTSSFSPSSKDFVDDINKMVKETIDRSFFDRPFTDLTKSLEEMMKNLPQYSVEITENSDGKDEATSLHIKATNVRTGKVYEATTGDKTYAQVVAEKEAMAAELESLRRYKRDRDLVRSLNNHQEPKGFLDTPVGTRKGILITVGMAVAYILLMAGLFRFC